MPDVQPAKYFQHLERHYFQSRKQEKGSWTSSEMKNKKEEEVLEERKKQQT
jgi:hypothetical protein